MRYLLVIFTICISSVLMGQEAGFPEGWVGKWKGQLYWYKGKTVEPVVVKMELNIGMKDSNGAYSWELIYGDKGADSRPYKIFEIDSSRGHWKIDEQNGIILDQFLVANRLSGAFKVLSSTIINNYWIENDELHVEFVTISAKPIATTGKGDKELPLVDSYEVKSYQKARLSRSGH